MPVAKKTTLNNLLGIAASNAAVREAAAKKAAAEAAAAEEAAAEEATDKAFGVIADVTGSTKEVGGFPAVTALMGRLADYAVTGVPAPGASSGGAPDPALVAERDALQSQVTDLTTQRDAAEAAKVAADAALSAANTANSNLQAQFDATTVAKDAAEAALANERDASRAGSLAQRLAQSQVGLDAVRAKVDELPELDLTKTTIGGAVKVPLNVAEKTNSVRGELRTLFGL